jgi:hypothetical protein
LGVEIDYAVARLAAEEVRDAGNVGQLHQLRREGRQIAERHFVLQERAGMVRDLDQGGGALDLARPIDYGEERPAAMVGDEIEGRLARVEVRPA